MKRAWALGLVAIALAGCGTQAPVPSAAVPAAASDAQAKGLFNQPVPVSFLLNETLAAYDHNRNDRIDLRPPSGWLPPYAMPNERVRTETTRDERRDQAGRVTHIVYTTCTYSKQDLFAAADANGDAVVTRQELLMLLASFDEDGDAKLSRRGFWGWLTRKERKEHDRFQLQYGERRVDVRTDLIPVHLREAQQQLESQATMVEAPTPAEALQPTPPPGVDPAL